MGNVNFDLRKD